MDFLVSYKSFYLQKTLATVRRILIYIYVNETPRQNNF